MKLGLARVEQLNLGLSAGAVAASFAFSTPHFATSLAAGAFLEALNLGAIHRAARTLFSGENASTRAWIGVFSMRFLFLAAAIFVTMQAGANPAAMLIGLSIAMPATLIDAWLNRPPVLDPATLPVLLEDESDDDAAYWGSYSVWRPGRLRTTQRDDLLSEAAPEPEADALLASIVTAPPEEARAADRTARASESERDS